MNDQFFTEFIYERIIPNGIVMILLIIAWSVGFWWRGVVFT